ncbi:hypothetical protein IFVP408_C290503 [Vibrio parahaemolyticus]
MQDKLTIYDRVTSWLDTTCFNIENRLKVDNQLILKSNFSLHI